MANLKETTITYLQDAGFKSNDFIFDNDINYIEVLFLFNDAVEYIIKDIIKSDYGNILEIKKYKYNNGKISAIITFI